jgi:hypothetical protein
MELQIVLQMEIVMLDTIALEVMQLIHLPLNVQRVNTDQQVLHLT